MSTIDKQKTNFDSNKADIGTILRDIFSVFMMGEEYYNSLGVVESINQEEATCVVQIADGARLENVRLQQIQTDSGLMIMPTIGMPVLVGWTDKTTASIVLYSQIDNIVFQGGTFGGLIKITELTAKINELIATINAMFAAFKSHNHTHPQGPTTGFVSSITQKDAVDFNKDDYENLNFTH